MNLLGLPKAELEAFVGATGQQAVPRAPAHELDVQARRGRHRGDDGSRQGFPRASSLQRAEVTLPEIVKTQVASDGTRKWLLSGGNGQAFETVFIPEEDRGTLCISSQVGCVLDCTFCSTAQQGFNRNLTTAEIVGQVWLANRELGLAGRATTASSPTSCSWAWASRWRISAT